MKGTVTGVECQNFMWIKPAEPELRIPNVDVSGPDADGKLTLLFEEGVPVELQTLVVETVRPRLLGLASTNDNRHYAATVVRTELVTLFGHGRIRRRFYKGWEFRTAEDGEWV